MLQRLSYFSHAAGQIDLAQLVTKAASANAQLGVTGLLLIEGGHYIQVLEGPRDRVSSLFLRIANDLRHSAVTLIEVGSIDALSYPDWGMIKVENALRTASLYRTSADGKFDPSTMSAQTLRDFIRLASFELMATVDRRGP